MQTISISYTLKWRHKNLHNYQLSECKKLFNVSRGTMVKSTVNGGVVGWWVGRKFLPKSKVNDNFEIIPKYELPF